MFNFKRHKTMEQELAITTLRSRAFRVKTRLRGLLILANQYIMEATPKEMHVLTKTRLLEIPKDIQDQLMIEGGVFLIRSDFMNLLDALHIKIKDITLRLCTGSDHAIIHRVSLHLESHGIDKNDEPLDLDLAVEFKLMPLCGIPNLLINGDLLDHLRKQIIKSIYSLWIRTEFNIVFCWWDVV